MLGGTAPALPQDEQPRRALDALIASYPDALAGHDGKALRWRDGMVMPVSDDMPPRARSFETLATLAPQDEVLVLRSARSARLEA